MSLCVGGPRYAEAPTVVETFDQWSSWNCSKYFLLKNNSHGDCGYVAKSPLYRNQYIHFTNPRMVAFNNNFDWCNNKNDQLDPFKDADNYGNVASQLSHIPIPVYSMTCSIRNSITSRQMHLTFFNEVKEQQYVK